MADTTPLRRLSSKSKPARLADVEAKTPREHYELNSNGIYSNHQYTDLALLLKKNILK